MMNMYNDVIILMTMMVVMVQRTTPRTMNAVVLLPDFNYSPMSGRTVALKGSLNSNLLATKSIMHYIKINV